MTDHNHGALPTPSVLEAIVENISDAIIFIDDAWRLAYMSGKAESVTGISKSVAQGQPFFEVFPESINTVFEQTYRHVKRTGKAAKIEAPFGPHYKWFSVNVFPIHDNQLCLAFHESSLNRRLQLTAQGQRDALNRALAGSELDEVLPILAETVEQQSGRRAVAVISLVREHECSVSNCFAPNLPESLQDWLQSVTINAETTPCGQCVDARKSIAIENMQTEKRWPAFTHKAAEQGLLSYWCTPIFSSENKSVLGTFGLFYLDPIRAIESDIQVIEALSRTAAILIERIQENKARLRAESALSENTEALNKQRRLYETALSNTPDPLYIFDLEGRFTYVNDALLEMWGIDWDEAVGKTCLELGYEKWHADMHMREIRQVIETRQPIRGDVPYAGTHGPRIYDYIFVPVIGDDGSVEAIAGTTRDVTERQRAVEIAKEAEARRRIALEASHSFGIWDWDIENNTFTADERLGELFNLSPEETKIGVPIEAPLRAIHKDDLARVEQAINNSITHGEPYDQEYRINQQDGTVRWGAFRGRVLFDENGVAVRFPGVGVDVTRERHAIDALKEADQRKDEFLATLAHELRNPLAPISNALKIVQSDVFEQDKKKTAFSLVERQVQQMIQLVDDLMDVSRITRGKIRLNQTPVSLSEVLDAAIETIQPLINECNHSLSVSYPQQEVWVNGDIIRLSQIFSNIINNAAKYTQSDGHISVKLTETGNQVSVSIEDNGSGIPEDKLDTIFDMFSQVDGVLERSQGGLGIGLTLVKRLTELHQGVVTVDSSGHGQGACFTVTLPRIARPKVATAADAPNTAKCQKAKQINVLIADDNQDAAITMGWLLEAKGCRVLVVEDGPAALEAVKNFTPDLVLLDIGMPGMNGYDLCIALRKNSLLENAIFVAQTGWGQPAHKKRSRESGFHHHLVKPLNLDDLLPILDEAHAAKAVLLSEQ